MSRQTIPFQAADVSSLARSLRAQWMERQTAPGHVEVLNMLARVVGLRNFQQLRAQAEGVAMEPTVSQPDPAPAPIDPKLFDRVRRCFAPDGRLARWPSKRGDQVLALWVLWSKLPGKVEMTEQEISRHLAALNDFGDHALLRRELCETGLFQRTPDCRRYRRVEKPPTAEAAALIALV